MNETSRPSLPKRDGRQTNISETKRTSERVLRLAESKRGVRATRWTATETTWSQLRERIAPERLHVTGDADPADIERIGRKSAEKPIKEASPAFVGGCLTGNVRAKGNVEARSLLTLDIDGGNLPMASLLAALPYRSLVYTTFSSTPSDRRWRVLIDLDRDVSAREYRVLSGYLADELDAVAEVDRGSLEPERLMFWPSAPKSRAAGYLHGENDRAALAVDAVLANLPAPAIEDGPAASYEGPAWEDLSDEQRFAAHDAVEARLTYWRATLTEALEWPEGHADDKGRGWEKLVSDCAFMLASLAHSAWADLSVPDAEVLYAEMVPEEIAAAVSPKIGHKLASQAARNGILPPWVGEEASEATSADPEHAEADPLREADVLREVRRLEVQAEARKRFAAGAEPPVDYSWVTREAFVADHPEPTPFRIEAFWPDASDLLLVAQQKTGKTTLCLNIAHSLTSGEAFLYTFAARPVDGVVAMLNYEVPGVQFGQWVDACGIDRERFKWLDLMGRPNPLAYPTHRDALAAQLRAMNARALLVDTFSVAFTGTNVNDAGEVRRFLDDLSVWARHDAGVDLLLLTTHSGWGGERSRGSSALEDWPSSIVTMTKDDAEVRYLRARGRDVDLAEGALSYDVSRYRMTWSGAGSRAKQSHAREIVKYEAAILDYLGDPERAGRWVPGSELKTELNGGGAPWIAARDGLVVRGVLAQRPRTGRGGGSEYQAASAEADFGPSEPNSGGP